jgi:Short C-terminal domain
MELFVVFAVWLMFAIGIGALASSRGRSGFGWGIFSFLFSPLLALLIILLMSDLKKDEENRAREDRRHQEQLAALNAASKAPSHVVLEARPSAGASNSAASGTGQADAMSSVADELSKLAALLEKGHLTAEEFAAQKARLLGAAGSTSATAASSGTPGVGTMTPQRRAELDSELSTPERCRTFLVSKGCTVHSPSDHVWEVVEPSGVTAYARTPEVLKSIAMKYAV